MADTAPHEEALPERFNDIEALEEFMTRPSPALTRALAALDGDIMVLGAGGKMGPTVARLAKRAAPAKRVIAVARFSDAGVADALARHGIETITADLLDRAAVGRLPVVRNVVFMAGRKFGSRGREDLTWAMNAYAPALVAERFVDARVVVYSTACVYPFVPVTSGGAREDHPLGPPGEYAMSCVARERMFQYFSALHGASGRLLRLSYAIDMRYGVLHDVARKVLTGEPVDLRMGHVNVIWQGDAASQSLRALGHCTRPASPLNVSGPETVCVRALAEKLGALMGRAPRLTGEEAGTAWLVDTGAAERLFGYPRVPLEAMIRWTADWVSRAMPSLDKETRFAERSGAY